MGPSPWIKGALESHHTLQEEAEKRDGISSVATNMGNTVSLTYPIRLKVLSPLF